jgi:hypothetical protein
VAIPRSGSAFSLTFIAQRENRLSLKFLELQEKNFRAISEINAARNPVESFRG